MITREQEEKITPLLQQIIVILEMNFGTISIQVSNKNVSKTDVNYQILNYKNLENFNKPKI
jgi:hypothetical protein